MPHECLHWRTKKAENIMSTCILLCQLRLGCFLNKFLAKWQVSWKMQVGLQPATELWEQLKACRLGRKSNNNNKPTQKTKNAEKITAFRDKWQNKENSSFESSAVLLKVDWISHPAEAKKLSYFLYLLHFSLASLQTCPSCFQLLFFFLIPLFLSHFLCLA